MSADFKMATTSWYTRENFVINKSKEEFPLTDFPEISLVSTSFYLIKIQA